MTGETFSRGCNAAPWTTTMTNDDKRKQRMYALGRTAGRQLRPGSPTREAGRRVGGSLLRRGLTRLLRRF